MSAQLFSFARDDRGNVAIMFALMMVPILGGVGLAVDYSEATKTEMRAVAAMDAANLAAVVGASDYFQSNPDATEDDAAKHGVRAAEKFFAENSKSLEAVELNFDVSVTRENNSWVAKSSFSGSFKTAMGSLIGIDTINISNQANSVYNNAFVPVLDIAMCIDATGSMQNTINSVKFNALSFYANLMEELVKRDAGYFVQIRVRPIFYRDYAVDKVPMRASPLMQLPLKEAEFQDFVNPEKASGGGDAPESGLECLNEAMDSEWVKVGDKVAGTDDPVTHVFPMIVIWTDAPALPLSHAKSLNKGNYPSASKMPRTADDLVAKWNDKNVINQKNKRIIFFGNPFSTSGVPKNSYSGWSLITTWPQFYIGGTLIEGNANMVSLIAKNVAGGMIGARVTQ